MHKDQRSVELVVKHAKQLSGLVSAAEAALKPLARSHGATGILVTRHDHHRYTVALDLSVPFGETWERSIL